MSDKSGSPPCGIYIRLSDFSDMPEIITKLRQAAMTINRASGYEKNMHVVELVSDGIEQNIEKIKDLITLIENDGLVSIVSGDLVDYNIFGADGIMLNDAASYKDARIKLGGGAIIGIACGGSRGDIQGAISLGADYITINAVSSLILWASAQGDILCVVGGGEINNHMCGALVRAGAGFIDATHYIMSHEKGVMQGAVNILHAIEMADQAPSKLN